jgi:hypothetical protein
VKSISLCQQVTIKRTEALKSRKLEETFYDAYSVGYATILTQFKKADEFMQILFKSKYTYAVYFSQILADMFYVNHAHICI